MEIKWHHDKKHKQWYTGEFHPYANDGYTIDTDMEATVQKYVLKQDHFRIIGRFKKLKSAKKVVDLLMNG